MKTEEYGRAFDPWIDEFDSMHTVCNEDEMDYYRFWRAYHLCIDDVDKDPEDLLCP